MIDPSTLKRQMVQFKLEDVTYLFKTDKYGLLCCLPYNAPYSLVVSVERNTMLMDNQKNGWKGVCIHQEANGKAFNCPAKALVHQVIHIRESEGEPKTLLSTGFIKGTWYAVTGEDASKGLKMAATLSHSPTTRGIPIERIDTHSLQSRGANALALSGYSNTKIQKWDDGTVQLLNSISEKNLHATQQACCQKWNVVSNSSIYQEMHKMMSQPHV